MKDRLFDLVVEIDGGKRTDFALEQPYVLEQEVVLDVDEVVTCMLKARDEAKLSEQVAARLVQLREGKKLSLREAAKKIGIGPTRLLSLESGKDQNTGKPTLPSAELTTRIALAYQVPREELLLEAGYLPWLLDRGDASKLLALVSKALLPSWAEWRIELRNLLHAR